MSVLPVVTPSPNLGTHGYVTIVDPQGYTIGTVAMTDGAVFGSISGESQFLFTSGGPPLANGVPSQLAFDRARGYLGKGNTFGAISSTVAGDTNLVFSVAPKSLMPGYALRLYGVGSDEYVYIAQTFVPSVSAVTIPLQSPVVTSGQVFATWDIFNATGPNGSTFSPVGVGLQVLAMPGAFSATLTAANSAYQDSAQSANILETVAGRLTSAATIERERAPDTFKAFNAQAVTIASSNTPTAIWTPTAGKRFRLMGYWFSTTVAAGLIFHDLATVGGAGIMPCPSPIHATAGVIQSPPEIKNGLLSATINNKLWIDATAATTLTGFIWGVEE